MQTLLQAGSDSVRIILLRRSASEILLRTERAQFALPTLDVPHYSRVVEECTRAIEKRFFIQSVCLFTPINPPAGQQPSTRYLLLEAYRSNANLPADMSWVSVDSLSVSSFQESADLDVVTQCLTDMAGDTANVGFFSRKGWLREVSEWVQSHATRCGLQLTGDFRQLNASPTFSLVRFATDGPALWFKAVGEPNLHELPLSIKLTNLFPEFVPRVVASRKEWNAWLTLEAPGTHLDASSNTNAWSCASRTLAFLQIASFGSALHLREAGSKDATIRSLFHLVDPFFAAIAERMEEQVTSSPQPLSRQELLWLATEIKVHLGQLGEGTIPNTLGHLDFNPGNILISDGHCVFLDWAEAYAGHPFFTFQYLLEHARRLRGADSEWEGALIRLYAKPWEFVASRDEIAAALQIAPLLGAFVFAATGLPWRNSKIGKDLETAGLLRGLTRRMKREAEQLATRRHTCLL